VTLYLPQSTPDHSKVGAWALFLSRGSALCRYELSTVAGATFGIGHACRASQRFALLNSRGPDAEIAASTQLVIAQA